MMNTAGEWLSTVLLAAMVLAFFVALGRSARPRSGWPEDPAPAWWQDLLHTALAGMRRLQELHRRTALPPWDHLDEHVPVERGPVPPDPCAGPRGD